MAKVALINLCEVDTGAIEDVVAAAELPSGHIRLVIGDETIEPQYQGLTIPRRFVPLAGNIYSLDRHLAQPWDCGVIIGLKWARLQPDFPCYFAYLLGHELGHASSALTNISHVAFEDLVLRFLPGLVEDRDWRCDDMPHEVRYDQFGLAIAAEVCGRESIEEEVAKIIEVGLSEDEDRLRKILSLSPRKDLDGILEKLAEFSFPHREALQRAWAEAREKGHLRVADGIPDLGALWSAN